jgi:hypothetical protein
MPNTTLPPKPQPPVDYDCCGGGCADCELRLFYQRLAEWRATMIERGLPAD